MHVRQFWWGSICVLSFAPAERGGLDPSLRLVFPTRPSDGFFLYALLIPLSPQMVMRLILFPLGPSPRSKPLDLVIFLPPRMACLAPQIAFFASSPLYLLVQAHIEKEVAPPLAFHLTQLSSYPSIFWWQTGNASLTRISCARPLLFLRLLRDMFTLRRSCDELLCVTFFQTFDPPDFRNREVFGATSCLHFQDNYFQRVRFFTVSLPQSRLLELSWKTKVTSFIFSPISEGGRGLFPSSQRTFSPIPQSLSHDRFFVCLFRLPTFPRICNWSISTSRSSRSFWQLDLNLCTQGNSTFRVPILFSAQFSSPKPVPPGSLQ